MYIKRSVLVLVALLTGGLLVASSPNSSTSWDMDLGKPQFESVGALAFGPDGVLYVGDSKGAAVYAIDLGDTEKGTWPERLNIQDIDQQIASLLGTSTKEMLIHDMAVHPVSGKIYLSVSRGRGNDAIPVIMRITTDSKLEEVPMKNVRFSKAAIKSAPAPDAKDRRGRSLRAQSITDLAFADGQLYVAGLSNEEFASHLRRIPVPFSDEMNASSIEIYHVSHGRYETNAPVRTFMPYKVGERQHILAAYTCTPLVIFPVDDLKDGAQVKGKTVAELGNQNRPLDIISYQKDGEDYILIANSNRTVMRIKADDLITAEGLTDPLKERYGSAGVTYTSMPLVGILQIDNLDADNIVMLRRNTSTGSLDLQSRPKSRL